MTMALLNYSNPFLGAATPAPFYGSPLALHHNVQQPSVLYGQQPLNQFNANSPYRRSEPPSQYQTQRNSVYIDQRHQYNNQQRSFPPNFKSSSYQNQGEPVREALRSHQQPTTPANIRTTTESNSQRDQRNPVEQPGSYPLRPIKYERVDPDAQKTSIHPIIDYDGDYEYYDDDEGNPVRTPLVTHVTPIQGPIFIKNGTVPVVPLYSYPVLNNGTFVQIPILWTALQVALGLELRGEIIRGVPCIKRYHQLFCPTAGNSYPIDKIELFIDENKALMKRMYGDFSMRPSGFGPPGGGRKKRRSGPGDPTRDPPGVPDLHSDPSADPFGSSDATGNGESYFSKLRKSRQSSAPNPPFRNNQSNESGRLDACESKVEIVTPYWASNSAGKIRAIVNTQHFEQAIHQEVCSKMRTNRCSGDCGCEQKYKWHRLLAYDPDNDCKGIFMDWFLFPSCCVCRCDPN